ncbi:NAD(P)-dependent oxidoreductase [Mangrovibacterium diazotrophicum]|uniref:Saccharopine dehydrogenase [NAD(+), L-lysine-forming] n=1 Tax=Mangrovibacterium diazotrophicum TaxID=1261403 RepID=A0A419W665_9BACT|nr:NAD(P)-dependent oxidoreductase [Mangrovibacterium diazotrophicum]RKD90947.1 alanine dehydrogenase [Mangrovibacterium diazotrophicum]
MKIGILRETRRWKDRRVAITPETAVWIKENYPNVELFVQTSSVRVHTDDEYLKIGIPVVEDVSHCDVLIGVKEVDPATMTDGKTYIMFAHVAKKQGYNQSFFAAMAKKKITLIDYEYFTDAQKNRVVAFGFWAGVVGTYYAFKGIAKRFVKVDLPGPDECRDLKELHHQLKQFRMPALKIVLTGGGRVAAGALEIIRELGIDEVSPWDFQTKTYEHAVFTRLDPEDYVQKKDGTFNQKEFYTDPSDYESKFQPYLEAADVFIACHFWNSNSPVFFTKEQLKDEKFGISLIADISCDLDGPIPTTIRTSSIEEPYYDVNPADLSEATAFSNPKHVTVMAVDNLPTALPLDASRTFARDMYTSVFPALFGGDADGIIERATILKNGELTSKYQYLEKFLQDALKE